MRKFDKSYLKAVVIVHGKSEKQMCDYIKSNLRLKLEIYGDKNGEKSIQITSIMRTLNNSKFETLSKFRTHFSDAFAETERKKSGIHERNFKIFIIMDTDDCNDVELENFKNKDMFRKHWAFKYIVPIWNTPDLEEVLVKAKIPFRKKETEEKRNT